MMELPFYFFVDLFSSFQDIYLIDEAVPTLSDGLTTSQKATRSPDSFGRLVHPVTSFSEFQ